MEDFSNLFPFHSEVCQTNKMAKNQYLLTTVAGGNMQICKFVTRCLFRESDRDIEYNGDSKLQRPRPAEKKTSSAQCDVTSTSNLIYLDNFTLAQKYTTFLLSPEGEQDQPNSRSFLDSRIWFSFYLRLSYAGQ